MQGQRPDALIQDFSGQPDRPGAGVDFELEPQAGDARELVDGAEVNANDNGTVDINLSPDTVASDQPIAFDANLCLVEGINVDGLAAEVCEAIEDDISSRQEWSEALAEGIRLLGVRKERRQKPFKNACGVWDPMMAEAVIRFWATFNAEILPPAGPVKTQVIGVQLDQIIEQATRVKDWMNYYYTSAAPEYYPDMNQLGFWLGLAGSMFKKIYQCPIKNRPVGPFVMPEDVIVPYTAVNLETAPRVTIVNHMGRRDIKLRQLKGLWRDFALTEPSTPGTTSTAKPVKDAVDRAEGRQPMTHWRGDEVFDVYETELDIDLTRYGMKAPKLEGLPLPYRIIIEKESMKPFALYRNWKQGDQSFTKKKQIVHYKFLPGLGFYGFGYAHVLGSMAETGTALRRQIIDAQTLAMFPGGLRVKGMKFDNNNKLIGPTEFPEVDTGGLPINQAIMMMPYKEMSQVPILTLQENSESARVLASNVEIAVGEGRQDAPVGTTVALMEGATKISSASLKLFHSSYREELAIYSDIFGRVLPEASYPFPVVGGQAAIMRADFSEHIDVIPVSDPNIVTSTQRIMRADAKLRLAMQAPQIHDLRAAYHDMYLAMGDPEELIAKILPPPQQAQPMDPLSENQLAITGGQLKAGEWQDHEAHIQAHSELGEIPAMMAHIAEHMAMKMRNEVQRILGVALPPLGSQLPPQIENQIAVLVAKAMKSLKAERGEELTPDQIVREQLQQEATKIANAAEAARQQVAAKGYAERLRFLTAERDRESRERMEYLKTAANTADNNVPPLEYVHGVIDLAKKAADVRKTHAEADAIENPPPEKKEPKS